MGGQCTPISGGRCTHVEGNPPIREYTPIRGVPPKPYGVMPRRACSQTRALLACRLLPQGKRREGSWRKQTRHGDPHFPIRRGLPYLQLWKSGCACRYRGQYENMHMTRTHFEVEVETSNEVSKSWELGPGFCENRVSKALFST